MRLFTTISTKLANTRGTFSSDRKKNCPLTRENIGGGEEEGRGGGGGGGELDQEKMFRERFEKLMKAWGKDGILFHGSAIIAHDGRSARPRGESQQHSRRWRMILMQAQHGVD